MLEITNIEYKERHPPAERVGERPYRCLVFSVLWPDELPARFVVDEQAIRLLDVPAAKGVISRRSVDKIVVRTHTDTIFSVVVFVRKGLAERVRARLLTILQGRSLTRPEEIGTSFQGASAGQVAEWLKGLGYCVECVTSPSAPAPMGR